MNKKKYTLKPGKHQFAPGSPAVHNNDNLSDEEAEWYLEKYPHIKKLFVDESQVGKSERNINDNDFPEYIPLNENIN